MADPSISAADGASASAAGASLDGESRGDSPLASAAAAAAFPFAPPRVSWRSDAPAPRFYEALETFPFLEHLLPHADAIFEEMRAARVWFDWPEDSLYDKSAGQSWKVLPFCHTFPSYDASKTRWVESAAAVCPRTVALLRRIPGLRTALFSRMGPRTQLTPHQGWADLSNHVLRIHLPLLVPDEDAGTCGIAVEGEVRYHKRGRLIAFDDSKMHLAFNKHASECRYVLIFDIARPEGLPRGVATGATTEELDSFIDYFS